jgi:thioredoxin-dependent peroxiredoxin
VRRSIFIVDPEGIIRFRHVAVLGLHYKDIADLGEALTALR